MPRTTTILCQQTSADLFSADIIGAGVANINIAGLSSPTLTLSVVQIVDFDVNDLGTTPVIALHVLHKPGPEVPFTPLALNVPGREPGNQHLQMVTIPRDLPEEFVAYGGGRMFLTTTLVDQPVPGPGLIMFQTSIGEVPDSRCAWNLTG